MLLGSLQKRLRKTSKITSLSTKNEIVTAQGKKVIEVQDGSVFLDSNEKDRREKKTGKTARDWTSSTIRG